MSEFEEIEEVVEETTKRKFKLNKKLVKWIALILILVVVVLFVRSCIQKKVADAKPSFETTTMKKQDIEMNLSGTGVIEPLNQYSVMPLVQGEVVADYFEEGDTVKKDDKLYQFSTKDVKNDIEAGKLTVQKAQLAYNDTLRLQKNLSLTSNVSGYVKKLYVKKGDMVAAGTVVADVYDNTSMILNVPFNADDVKPGWVGKSAKVYVGEEGSRLNGVVTEVSPTTEVMPGNMVVKRVKILVRNPGGITTSTTATANVDGIECNSDGTFEVREEKALTANKTGEIASLNLREGGYVKNNSTYAALAGEDIASSIQSAKLGLSEAKLALKTRQNQLENYTVKAPISGRIITKNIKKGDNVNASSAQAGDGGVMAIIYDLSAMTFKMNVDELDVHSLKVGQKVQVTADAVEDRVFEGYIDNISLNAEAKNGVTQYPVTIRINKIGDLLPGMNVTGNIITESAKNVNCIPVLALQRGNIVYVKDPNYNPDDKKKDKKGDISSTAVASNPGVPEGFIEKSVVIGINDGNFIQVISGLKDTDEIYVPAIPQKDYLSEMMSGGGMQIETGPEE